MFAQPSDAILARLMTLHPKVIDLSLDRIEDLLARLGRPQDRLPPVVHVAGTNGKGSVIAFMRAALEAAGYRVHLYISPHLVRFHERIGLAGKPIAEDELAALLARCEEVNGGAPITYFEITTAAAYLAFSGTPADILLLECGLGGRLDATNVIERPLATVITPVSIDHQHFLGATLAEIAFEKAAIQKPGVPSVIGRQPREAAAVIDSFAARTGAPTFARGRGWSVESAPGGLIYSAGGTAMSLPRPVLPGAHQVDNAGLAIACLERLAGFSVGESALAEGLVNADWPGRLQRLTRGPLVDALGQGCELWLDGGHNAAAGEALAAHAAAHWRDGPLHLVCGMLNSKQVGQFLEPLAGVAAGVAAIAVPGEDASLSAAEFAKAARAAGLTAQPADSLAAAIAAIAAGGGPVRRILICGSLYLAGRVLSENG
jgi:dihydrofolate synthase/folylpolyglutamate synthase